MNKNKILKVVICDTTYYLELAKSNERGCAGCFLFKNFQNLSCSHIFKDNGYELPQGSDFNLPCELDYDMYIFNDAHRKIILEKN